MPTKPLTSAEMDDMLDYAKCAPRVKSSGKSYQEDVPRLIAKIRKQDATIRELAQDVVDHGCGCFAHRHKAMCRIPRARSLLEKKEES